MRPRHEVAANFLKQITANAKAEPNILGLTNGLSRRAPVITVRLRIFVIGKRAQPSQFRRRVYRAVKPAGAPGKEMFTSLLDGPSPNAL
jgi:hypothetical protein